jgi:hypothetical protein
MFINLSFICLHVSLISGTRPRTTQTNTQTEGYHDRGGMGSDTYIMYCMLNIYTYTLIWYRTTRWSILSRRRRFTVTGTCAVQGIFFSDPLHEDMSGAAQRETVRLRADLHNVARENSGKHKQITVHVVHRTCFKMVWNYLCLPNLHLQAYMFRQAETKPTVNVSASRNNQG